MQTWSEQTTVISFLYLNLKANPMNFGSGPTVSNIMHIEQVAEFILETGLRGPSPPPLKMLEVLYSIETGPKIFGLPNTTLRFNSKLLQS